MGLTRPCQQCTCRRAVSRHRLGCEYLQPPNLQRRVGGVAACREVPASSSLAISMTWAGHSRCFQGLRWICLKQSAAYLTVLARLGLLGAGEGGGGDSVQHAGMLPYGHTAGFLQGGTARQAAGLEGCGTPRAVGMSDEPAAVCCLPLACQRVFATAVGRSAQAAAIQQFVAGAFMKPVGRWLPLKCGALLGHPHQPHQGMVVGVCYSSCADCGGGLGC